MPYLPKHGIREELTHSARLLIQEHKEQEKSRSKKLTFNKKMFINSVALSKYWLIRHVFSSKEPEW